MQILPLAPEPFTGPTDRDQAEPITHWISATMPWDAADRPEG